MLDKIFNPQLTSFQDALGRTTQRQALLVQDLANVNVPGYKRKDMDFHVALEGEMGPFGKTQMAQKEAAAQKASDQTSLREDGNNVDMEKEVTSISETDLHYQALTSIVSDYFSGLKSAIHEGK